MRMRRVRSNRPINLLLTAALALGLVASPAAAERIFGSGATGSPGADAVPGGDGGDGGDGGSVSESTGPTDPANQTSLAGGRGGQGGDGGPPNGSGGDGGDGGDAVADSSSIQTSGSAFAEATASGGLGGGGGAAESSGSGTGGLAGAAGDAEATTFVSNSGGSGSATSRATGGTGGVARGTGVRGADGGTATASSSVEASTFGSAFTYASGGAGGSGLLGADGGDGASLSLGDTSTVVVTTAESAVIRRTQTAIGGRGGASAGGIAGNGGDASAWMTSEGLVGDSLRLEQSSVGGDAGNATVGGTTGVAGNAISHAEASFEGDVFVSTSSIGGDGGHASGDPGAGSDGGSATATAIATSLAEGARASASAGVTGGDGGNSVGMRARDGVDAGDVSATASATATGRSLASVHATGGDGGNASLGGDAGDGGAASLENAVHAVGGHAELVQHARGGSGGDVWGTPAGESARTGRGGDATSILEATNGLGDIEMRVDAIAGNGGRGSGATTSGGAGGDAHAAAVATANGGVEIFATATAGVAGDGLVEEGTGVDGAQATLGPVRGVSTSGGLVEVTGTIRAGRGGGSYSRAGAGADAILVDAVDGETTGDLVLHQSAIAGDAGNRSIGGVGVSPAVGARGGEAISQLTRRANSESSTLHASSFAGGSSGADDSGESISGGDATTRLDGHNEGGDLVLRYQAEGGGGSDPDAHQPTGGRGGTARSIVHATTEGDGHAIRVEPGDFFGGRSTRGGQGGERIFDSDLSGGDGGIAITEIKAIADGDSEVDIHASAHGGAGGRGSSGGQGGAGGSAAAVARALNSGSSTVEVLAEAVGGYGALAPIEDAEDNAGTGGNASATAFGRSLGGGDVTATARVTGGGGAGVGVSGSAGLEDAVGGQTLGRLRLVQEANGGDRSQGIAGDASSSLIWIDDDGGALEIESIANGGEGEQAGTASASAFGTGLDDVRVVARATGGDGAGAAGDGGSATIESVVGRSARGGLVRVEAHVTGGDGRDGTTGSFSNTPGGGSGANVLIEDAVDGRTSGMLEWVQTASGGRAGDLGSGATSGGTAGSATNRLTRGVSAARLDVHLEAFGGRGSNQQSSTPGATDGAAALVETDLTNDAGSVVVAANAVGGESGRGLFGEIGGAGGDATVWVSATTTRSDQAVTIGAEPFGFRAFGARGGDSRVGTGRGVSPGVAARGGHANSRSVGTALGNSVVRVLDRASGGDGFDGGNAISEARGRNKGAQSVTVQSEANAGDSLDIVGKAGDAHATAVGTSIGGAMDVRAFARGGSRRVTSSNPLGMDSGTMSVAYADATGSSGIALAQATSWTTGQVGTPGYNANAIASASVSSRTRVEAVVGGSARAALVSDKDVSANVNGLTSREGEFARIGLNILWEKGESPDEPFAFASISPNSYVGAPDGLDGIFVSFLDLRIDDANYEEMAFRIENGDQLLLERNLATAEDARVFFDSILDLGDYDDGSYFFGLALRFTLEGGSDASLANLGTYFAVGTVAVPEPGTGVLILAGLIVLCGRRRAGQSGP